MYKRLTTVCHLWPGITPFNVFGLPYSMWVSFAEAADEYQKSMKEASRG